MVERDAEATNPASTGASQPGRGRLQRKIWELRTNSRFAYVLQIGSRVFASALGLIWARLLTEAMGKPLNGLYITFQSFFSLGGLGDLGMGGAVGIRAGQYLGEGKSKEPELLRFLASARSVFLVLALVCAGGMLVLSHWLPQWYPFPAVEGAGSLARVFQVGAVMVGGVLLFSYVSNLNYACGNVTWPVLPDFLLLQISLVFHLWLAREGQPLWIQYLPYAGVTLAKVYLMWFYIRASHFSLSRLWPLGFDWPLAVNLFEGSFWVYFCCLGNAFYRNTDNLVITAGFPAGTNLDYYYNYRFCDLMVFVVTSASFVALPKITQWLASPHARDQARVGTEMLRLNQFQILLGCGAALGYLAFNDYFMKLWWFHAERKVLPAALSLQIAFALNLAVTASGDTALQLALRSGKRGLRIVGMLVGFTGLLNFGLSIVAMKMSSLAGIAMATVLAQSCAMLGSSLYLCRHLKIAWLPWAFRGCVLPLAVISFAGWLRILLSMDSMYHAVFLLGIYAVMFLLAARALGVDAAMIKHEVKIFQKFFGK